MEPIVDEIDRLLIEQLIADGRATLSALAEKASLSVSAVQSRVRRLESRGVIKGYTARIDHEALGRMLTAFVAITPLDQFWNSRNGRHRTRTCDPYRVRIVL